jgi:nucleoside-diphosphate-sugar epimerase
MRMFVAGATGVIGMRLAPLLVEAGHTVAGMTRSLAKVAELEALGAEALVCDVYDLEALRAAVARFEPDGVMHQLTNLPDDASQIPELGGRNDRMRGEGTRNLIAAAHHASARRIYAQSMAWQLPRDRGVTVREHERGIVEVVE